MGISTHIQPQAAAPPHPTTVGLRNGHCKVMLNTVFWSDFGGFLCFCFWHHVELSQTSKWNLFRLFQC